VVDALTLLSVETYGHLGKPAWAFLDTLAEAVVPIIQAGCGATKAAFVAAGMRELCAAPVQGNAIVHRETLTSAMQQAECLFRLGVALVCRNEITH
jgi:hypothetical protein